MSELRNTVILESFSLGILNRMESTCCCFC